HRIGTMEVESAVVDHPKVAECAVVGRTHDLKGQAVAAFVTVKEGVAATPELAEELRQHVGKKIGAIAKPDDIIFAADLPKTRSGRAVAGALAPWNLEHLEPGTWNPTLKPLEPLEPGTWNPRHGHHRNARPLEDLRDGQRRDPRSARGKHRDSGRRVRGHHGA